jgi:methionyl-tRNA formyltransferase
MSPRIVFMGSPEFAIPSLQALSNKYEITGVVTQPDRLAGRGRSLKSPPIKDLAIELRVPVIQPRSLKDENAIEQLKRWEPEFIVVAAFGQILRPQVLDLPPQGCINVHASLLPRWRGAAPIPAAILHDDSETGVTIMLMDPGVDTGPVLSQRTSPIQPDDTTASLSPRLARMGADLLLATLPGYLNGSLQPKAQNNEQATYAPMLKKEDGLMDFSLTAQQLSRQVRAYIPWPGAYTFWKNQRLAIHQVSLIDNKNFQKNKPGITLITENKPAVATGKGILVLEEVQLAGKKPVSGTAFLLGVRDWENGILSG